MYYCPMCGAWFEVGAERCEVCSVPLPASAPNVPEMERAEERRAGGFSLARMAFARGARLQAGNFRLIAVPVLSALLLAWVTHFAILNELASVGGTPAGLAAGTTNVTAGAPTVLGAFLVQAQSLFNPLSCVQQTSAAVGYFGQPIPPFGVEHAPATAALAMGTPTLPTKMLAYVSTYQAVYTAAVLLLSLIQWWQITRILLDAKPHRSDRRIRIGSTIAPLIMLIALPVAAALARPILAGQLSIVAPVVSGIASMMLAVWASASLFGPSSGVEPGYLIRRGIFSSEGICFILFAMPLLWIAQITLVLWQGVGIAALAEYDSWIGVFFGTVACSAAFGLTSLVTCGWFCLMDALADRTDVNAMLDGADRPQAAEAKV